MLDMAPIADLHPLADAWRWIVAAWVFAVGASVGSFLNVVIYRLPAGLSIAHPPSHCPACKKPIRAYDNIPIFSWLLLGGRCRNCKARFSSRYAWIEFIAGAVLLAVAATGPAFRYDSFDRMLEAPQFLSRWGEVAFYAVLLASIWSAAMIAHDTHPPPWRLLAFPLTVGIVCGMIWFRPCSLPYWADSAGSAALRVISPWNNIFGFLVALTTAAFSRILGTRNRAADRSETCPLPIAACWGGLCGLYLGWQFALVAHAVTAFVAFVTAVALALRSTKPGQSGGKHWLTFHALVVTAIVLLREPSSSLLCTTQFTFPPATWQAAWPLISIAVIAGFSLAARFVASRNRAS